MKRVVVTLDDDLAGSLSRYARRRQLNRDVAAERLLAAALAEWRRDRAVCLFAAGEHSFEQASAAADVDRWRFAELLHERTNEVSANSTTTPPETCTDSLRHDGSRRGSDRIPPERATSERVAPERATFERVAPERATSERVAPDRNASDADR